MTNIVDLSSIAVANRQKEAIAETGGTDTDPSRLYEFGLKDGKTFQAFGMLMLTGSFFACGTPRKDGQAVDFEFAAPADQINYVVSIDDELVEDIN